MICRREGTILSILYLNTKKRRVISYTGTH